MVSGRTCRSTDTDGARSSVNAGSGLCMWIPCCTTLPVSPALIGLLCGCVQTNPRDRDEDLSGLPTACQHQPGYNAYNGCSFSFVNARNSGAGTNQSRDGRIYPGREPIRQLPVSTYLLPLQPPTSTGPVDPHTPNFEATYCLRTKRVSHLWHPGGKHVHIHLAGRSAKVVSAMHLSGGLVYRHSAASVTQRSFAGVHVKDMMARQQLVVGPGDCWTVSGRSRETQEGRGAAVRGERGGEEAEAS
eukprot:1196030-Prorocentrum_minimum.AAC.2